MEIRKYPIGGFAPGNYMCKCVNCKEKFTGDKRAVQCESCAGKIIKNELNALKSQLKQEKQPKLTKTLNTELIKELEIKIQILNELL